jgi:hypothetical protein
VRIPSFLLLAFAALPAFAQQSPKPTATQSAPSPAADSPRGALITEDDCSSPHLITGYGLFSFDNSNATTDGLPHAACNFFSHPQTDRDVWALWTAPASGNTIFSTCGLTSLDTKLVVYRPGAVCPATDEFVLTCDDDGGGLLGGNSSVSFFARAGQKYLVRIGVYPGAHGGAGQIRITNNNAAPGVCSLNDCQAPALTNASNSNGSGFRVADDYVPPESGDIDLINVGNGPDVVMGGSGDDRFGRMRARCPRRTRSWRPSGWRCSPRR